MTYFQRTKIMSNIMFVLCTVFFVLLICNLISGFIFTAVLFGLFLFSLTIAIALKVIAIDANEEIKYIIKQIDESKPDTPAKHNLGVHNS